MSKVAGESRSVAASEFVRNFGRYRMHAQREAVAVSNHGQITGYFVGAAEYEAFLRYKASRRSFATAALSDDAVAAVAATRMGANHADLDQLMDQE